LKQNKKSKRVTGIDCETSAETSFSANIDQIKLSPTFQPALQLNIVTPRMEFTEGRSDNENQGDVVDSIKDRWAFSAFQNSPDPILLPMPNAVFLSPADVSPGASSFIVNYKASISVANRPEVLSLDLIRIGISEKLRAALSESNSALLAEAVADADAAGMTHEASIGRRKLANMRAGT
jgi:hypothetical protein